MCIRDSINVGVSGPGVVYHALQSVKGQPLDVVAETVKKTAFQVTRMGQLVAKEASSRLDTPFGIVDLSLAPTPAIGDSVARILEEMGLEVCGTHGTTAALALLNGDEDAAILEDAGDADFDLKAVDSAKTAEFNDAVIQLLSDAGVTNEWKNHTDVEPFLYAAA